MFASFDFPSGEMMSMSTNLHTQQQQDHHSSPIQHQPSSEAHQQQYGEDANSTSTYFGIPEDALINSRWNVQI